MALSEGATMPARTRRWTRGLVAAAAAISLGCGSALNLTTPAQADPTYEVVTSASWKRLHVRSGPGTSYDIVAKLKRGTRVSVICTVADGTPVTGPLGTSSLWDKIGENPDRFVADQFLRTRSDKPVAPPCIDDVPAPPPAPAPQQIDYEFDKVDSKTSEIRFNMAATRLATTSEGAWCNYITKVIPKKKLLPLWLIAKGEENFCKIGYWMFREEAKRAVESDQCLKWVFVFGIPRATQYNSEFCHRS